MRQQQEANEHLFAYGSLQSEHVQLATFGRRLEGKPDALVGYRLVTVRISDADFIATSGSAEQRSLQFTGVTADSVSGTVFKVSENELEQADAYEPEGYAREVVQLESGIRAWVYLARQRTANREALITKLDHG